SFSVLFILRVRSRRDLHSFPTRRSSDLPMNVYLTGVDPRSGRRFIGGEALGIGWGGHATGDGESALINYGGGDLKNFPVETMERSEEHTSELQSLAYLVCRLLLEKKKKK